MTEAALGGVRRESRWMGLGGGEEAMDVLAVHSGSHITYLGLVDMLTEWTPAKKLEHFINGRLHGGRDISCQPPARYAERMLTFLEAAITSEPPPEDGTLGALPTIIAEASVSVGLAPAAAAPATSATRGAQGPGSTTKPLSGRPPAEQVTV